MRLRAFTILSALSLLLCAAMVTLWVRQRTIRWEHVEFQRPGRFFTSVVSSRSRGLSFWLALRWPNADQHTGLFHFKGDMDWGPTFLNVTGKPYIIFQWEKWGLEFSRQRWQTYLRADGSVWWGSG